MTKPYLVGIYYNPRLLSKAIEWFNARGFEVKVERKTNKRRKEYFRLEAWSKRRLH